MAAPQDWSVFRIREHLARKGYRFLPQLAEQAGLDQRALADALRRPHERAEREIARAIGVAPSQIWPSRYSDDGQRLKPQPPANYGRAQTAGHGQSRTGKQAHNRKPEIAA